MVAVETVEIASLSRAIIIALEQQWYNIDNIQFTTYIIYQCRLHKRMLN